MSFGNPDAYNFYFQRMSNNNFQTTTFAPYQLGGALISLTSLGMPVPERTQLRTWHILPDGNFDAGLTSDVVISITRNGTAIGFTTQTFEKPDADDRIIDITSLILEKGDTLGIQINKTTAVNPGSDRNNYNMVITGIFIRSD